MIETRKNRWFLFCGKWGTTEYHWMRHFHYRFRIPLPRYQNPDEPGYDPSQPITCFNRPPIFSMSLRELDEWNRNWL